jgi:hypothetical protein
MTAIARFGLVLLTWLAAAPVAAQTSEDRDPREVAARKACASGQVDRGIALLSEIIGETSDPTPVYDQARCYQQNGRPAQAIQRFREYLRLSPNAPADEVARIRGFIHDLEAEGNRGQPPPEQSLRVAAAPAGGAPGRGLRIAALGLAGAALVAIGAGVYFSARVGTKKSDVEGLSQVTDRQAYDRMLSDGRSAEHLQWVGYGIGAAALMGGGVCYWLSERDGERSPTTASTHLVPIVSTGLAGALLRVRY